MKTENQFVKGLWVMAILSFGFSQTVDAVDVTWDAGGTGTNWSTNANWSDDVNGVQTGDNVTFDNVGTQDDDNQDGAVPVTTSVDATITIGKLLFRNMYDYTDNGVDVTSQDVYSNWHHLEIQNGTTLTVTNDLIVGVDDVPIISGTNDRGDVDTTVLISGEGKLVVTNSTKFIVDPYTDRFDSGSRTILDMRELAELDLTTVLFLGVNMGGTDGYVYLSPLTTVTADTFGIGGWSNKSYLYLGQNSVLNVDEMLPGAAIADSNNYNGLKAYLLFQAGLTDPTVTLRGRMGGDSRGSMMVGRNGQTVANTTLVDFTGGIVDARFQDLTLLVAGYNLGQGYDDGTGTFTFDRGTVDAVNVVVAKGSTKMRDDFVARATGILNVGSSATSTGVLIAENLILGDNESDVTGDTEDDPLNQRVEVYATVNFKGGTIKAENIKRGVGTDPDSTRVFNWESGTIANKSGTNLTIGTGLDFNLLTYSSHLFEADTGKRIDVNGTITQAADAAGITMTGSGTLGGTGELVCALSVSSDATLAPGTADTIGAMTVSNLTMGVGSAFSVRLDGTGAGQSDQLVISGAATLEGELDVILGYAPEIGDTFTVIDNQGSSSVSGQFSTKNVSASYDGREYHLSVHYNVGDGNDVVLEVVPPGTIFIIR